MFNTPHLDALSVEQVSIEHFLTLYRGETYEEPSLEGFKEFFSGLNTSVREIATRCSAWFRLRPPVTDVNAVKRALDSKDITFDQVMAMEVPTLPHTKDLVSVLVERLETKEKILADVKAMIPKAVQRYSGYINRADRLGNTLPDASIWNGFKHDYAAICDADQAVFVSEAREGLAEFDTQYTSLGDYVNAGQRLDRLNAAIHAQRPSRVKEDVDRLSGVIDRLQKATKEHALPDAWKQAIGDDVLQLARWIEYYAITVYQLMQLTQVVVATGKLLKDAR